MNLISSCNRVSDERKQCSCGSVNIIKNSFTKTQKQQYYCKSCRRRFIAFYSYKACRKSTSSNITRLLKEGGTISLTQNQHKLINSMTDKQTVWEKSEYTPLVMGKDIPNDIRESKNRFISIYKGRLEVWGPTLCNHPINASEKQINGYVYLKSKSNNLRYLYTIILPGR
ncbi:IS1/IS1595 family N-terminal zinc-binding domain-containing protein [Taibaiella koreensis]